jgi:hypothetical protein
MYLITQDYKRVIQTAELNAITENSASVRQLVEGTVERQIRAHLIHKYDLTEEFRDLLQIQKNTLYKAGQRIYLDATAYSAAATYALQDLVLQGGVVYRCSTAIAAPEAFTLAHWTVVGNQYDLFYVKYPKEVFDPLKVYLKDDEIWYKDKTYTAQRDSSRNYHENDLQQISLEYINISNIFPDDRDTNAARSMWGVGVDYSINSSVYPPTNATVWTSGDNRNQHFVGLYLDMVVYELSKRIAPNNVPEARHNAWLKAVDTLKAYAKGNITAELPLLPVSSVNRNTPVSYGGKVPRQNSW